MRNLSLNVTFIFDITSKPRGILEQSGIGHVLISDLDLWFDVEAFSTLKQTFNRPLVKVKSVYLKARQANLIIKAGDLSNYITHFIGLMRDEYLNFLNHELKEVFFTHGNKVLQEYFSEYPKELQYIQLDYAQLNLLTLL